MSFEKLEVPCIFVPEGGKLPPTPWGDPAIFPAIFIPDGYQGPPPGYPWIEFGRISLRVGEAGGPRAAVSAATTAGGPQFLAAPHGSREAVSSATAARPRQPSSVSDAAPSAVALDQPAAGSLAPIAASTDESELATNLLPDLSATVRSWNAVSDLSATMAALDALSPTGPQVRGLTGIGQGDLPGEGSRSVQVWLAAATASYGPPGPDRPGG